MLCNKSIGDEFYYLPICENQQIVDIRDMFIPTKYYQNPTTSIIRIKGLFPLCNIRLFANISKFNDTGKIPIAVE